MKGKLTDGREVKLWFRHYTDPNYQRGTSAFIVVINNEYSGIEYTGITRLNPIDQFNKEIGRQYALERAIEGSNLSEADKDIVWTVYNSRGGLKPISNGATS